MPQIIPDFKSKTWETTDCQCAVYFKLGFQIPWVSCYENVAIYNYFAQKGDSHKRIFFEKGKYSPVLLLHISNSIISFTKLLGQSKNKIANLYIV